MVLRVITVIAVIIVVSLIRGAGYQLGWLGWFLVFFILSGVIFVSPSKEEKRSDTNPALDEEAIDEVKGSIRQEAIKADEGRLLEDEVYGIDESLEPEKSFDYPVNSEIQKLCDCLSGFIYSLSLFKEGKWQKGVEALAEMKEQTEKSFRFFVEKDRRYFADINYESIEKAKAIAERTFAFLLTIELNWWESEKLGAAVNILEKTEKALIRIGKGFFIASHEASDKFLMGTYSQFLSFEEGLAQINRSHDLMESGVLTKDEFERIKGAIFCKMKIPE